MSYVKALAVFGLLALSLAIPQGSAATVPANDNFANATAITGLPFSDTVDVTWATVESGEPGGMGGWSQRSIWYSFTPLTDEVVTMSRGIGPPYDPSAPPTLCDLRMSNFMHFYRADGAGLAGLTMIDRWSSSYTFRVQTGATYYIQEGDSYAGPGPASTCPRTFSLYMRIVPPPSNDNFSNALAFTSVPFTDNVDLTGATIEPGEPTGCGGDVTQSAWYTFKPTVSGGYTNRGGGVNVYVGASLGSLQVVECGDWFGADFWATAGTTYYLQDTTSSLFVQAVSPPAADFLYSLTAPSIFDDVSFSYWNGGYWDPAVNSWSWDFGDGATAAGQTVSHRFARDGDYQVTLTVHAGGGRTNTRTHTVRVGTPDTTPPSLQLPPGIVVKATGPTGSRVEFSVSASDNVDPSPLVACLPRSGTTFAIGDTTVSCTATDFSGNQATATFNIHVKGAPEQLADLHDHVIGVGPGTSLRDKITVAQAALSAHNVASACSILDAFINQVKAQTGKTISQTVEAGLISDATRVKTVLGH
jgi:hypothetical protein